MASNDGRAHAQEPSLREVFDRDATNDTFIRVDAQHAVYATGDDDDAMYLIESGQVKLSMSSASGKDCLIAIYAEGDLFGESCFTESERRTESAVAMNSVIVRRLPRREFILAVERAGAMHALLRHLATRLAERETAVFDVLTMQSERRLAKTLLAVAERLGSRDGQFLKLDQRISHEELSQIVGTTRPRITAFLAKFKRNGLLDRDGRVIKVHEAKLREYVGSE